MHTLPKRPPDLIPTFERLCATFPPDCIPDLRKGVATALERLRAPDESLLGPNLDLAEQIAERLYYLIDNYRNFPEAKHPLIVGALRYFMIERDLVPDPKPIVGLDDDARVLNYVLSELGLDERCVDVPQGA